MTEDRASELLKLLNGFRGSVEYIETMDFKGLKKSRGHFDRCRC